MFSFVSKPRPCSVVGPVGQSGQRSPRQGPCFSAHYIFQWRIHASAFLNHWTRGTLSLQGGRPLSGSEYLFCSVVSHGVAGPGPTSPAREQRRFPAGQHVPRILLQSHLAFPGLPDLRLVRPPFPACPGFALTRSQGTRFSTTT